MAELRIWHQRVLSDASRVELVESLAALTGILGMNIQRLWNSNLAALDNSCAAWDLASSRTRSWGDGLGRLYEPNEDIGATTPLEYLTVGFVTPVETFDSVRRSKVSTFPFIEAIA